MSPVRGGIWSHDITRNHSGRQTHTPRQSGKEVGKVLAYAFPTLQNLLSLQRINSSVFYGLVIESKSLTDKLQDFSGHIESVQIPIGLQLCDKSLHFRN